MHCWLLILLIQFYGWGNQCFKRLIKWCAQGHGCWTKAEGNTETWTRQSDASVCILEQFHPFSIQFSAVSSFPSLGLPLKMGMLEGKGPPRATTCYTVFAECKWRSGSPKGFKVGDSSALSLLNFLKEWKNPPDPAWGKIQDTAEDLSSSTKQDLSHPLRQREGRLYIVLPSDRGSDYISLGHRGKKLLPT